MPLNISNFLSQNEHLLLLADQERAFSQLTHLINQSQSHVSLVSEAFPLLSGIDLIENITLCATYRKNISQGKATRYIMPFVELLGLQEHIHLYRAQLNREQRIKAYLLRAISCESSVVCLIKPALWRVKTLFECLERVRLPLKIWIATLGKDAQDYTHFPLTPMHI